MSISMSIKPKEQVVPLAPRQLPFETWRPIFQVVYATQTSISHPPSEFVWSTLNSRLNIYRNLALVSRSWRANARDVFFEELEAHTIDALKGIVRIFQNDRTLALAVSQISFSFSAFRCSASMPRKPRPLRPPTELEAETEASAGQGGSPSAARRLPDWKMIHRRDARHYMPSTTAQGNHWTRWQADVGQILAMCTSLSEVDITFTNNHHPVHLRSSRDYRTFFAPPDLTNECILNGLLYSTNLRRLHLVDPTPLEQFGPALASWTRLRDLSIVLTRSFGELEATAFCPPKSLVSFRFHDRSRGEIPWPLASDLARCTNLQVLDLGVTSLTSEQTARAIGFLCSAYQHSLRELTLDPIPSGRGESPGFQPVLESLSPLHFTKLERLRLLEASYDTSVFSYFKADELKYLEVGWLMLEPGAGSREDKWSRGLSHTSLKVLKQLVINKDDPDALRKQALNAVCERLGITLTMGRTSRDSEVLADEEGEDDDFHPQDLGFD